jgi:hypothetical protein
LWLFEGDFIENEMPDATSIASDFCLEVEWSAERIRRMMALMKTACRMPADVEMLRYTLVEN